MAKRSNGEGTIYKRNDGRWCASKYIEYDDGRVKRRYVYGKTQKEVLAKLKKLDEEAAMKEGAEILLKDWMVLWLNKYKKNLVKVTTYDNYLLNIQTHISGSWLGDISLSKITTGKLQSYYNEKFEGTEDTKALSRRTVEYLRTIIGNALDQAYKNELIAKNPNKFTVLPREVKQEINPLTVEEIQKLMVAAKKSDIYALLMLEIHTGMRKGEILGLQWQNVDLDKKVLYVRKSLCRVQIPPTEDGKKSKLVLMEPKTRKSVRTIPLSDGIVKIMKQHRIAQNEEKMRYRNVYIDNDLVFAKRDGNFEDPRELLKKLHKVLEEAGVRKCRFHDLRHSFASVLLNEGESMKNIQELLGHSSIVTSMDIYGHLSGQAKRNSIEVFAKAVNGNV